MEYQLQGCLPPFLSWLSHGRYWLWLGLACFTVVGCRAGSTADPATATVEMQSNEPTLEDLWQGRATFELDVVDTGLPMGESDTVVISNGEFWSYLHASHESAGVIDQCGDPVEFPGCVVVFRSQDGGRTFQPSQNAAGNTVCQFDCMQCPCESTRDHIDQQQYPRVVRHRASAAMEAWTLVYEYRANVIARRSTDGLQWSAPEEIPLTGIWQRWLMSCRPEETIGPHPVAPDFYECLTGSPPGIFVEDGELFVFVGLGQNPGAMGCYLGPVDGPAALLRKCDHAPLFTGASSYGPIDVAGPAANPYFDFRTISSAEVLKIGDRYFMLYEGVRGPAPGDAGDTQFALGLARSAGAAIDGAWERFAGNPILVDLPGNVGVGHADLVVDAGRTLLYTSVDGAVRSRFILTWIPP